METTVALQLPGRIKPETLRLANSRTLMVTVDLEDQLVEVAGLIVDLHKRRAFAEGREFRLSTRNWQLLELLASDPERVVSLEEILEADPGTTVAAKTRVRHLRERLKAELPGRPWLKNHFGRGWQLIGT